MRISDWSSDVCSSDLIRPRPDVNRPHFPARDPPMPVLAPIAVEIADGRQIGRFADPELKMRRDRAGSRVAVVERQQDIIGGMVGLAHAGPRPYQACGEGRAPRSVGQADRKTDVLGKRVLFRLYWTGR